MDTANLESIRLAFKQVETRTRQLDVLINNAAIMLSVDKHILSIDPALVLDTVHTNGLGPLFIVQTFLPLLKSGSRVINMSSSGGQICGGSFSTWSPMYCVSKTLLNAITLQLSAALAKRGVAVNAVCPGWVQTDMGGGGAPRTVEQGADTPVWLATEAPLHVNGRFLQDRQDITW
jgi:NAD(P)-dependent dehydrogenase (short-subunit alcohol dehydrogenase family)